MFTYGFTLLITAELIIAAFGELYNWEKRTFLFSPNYRDGTPKPESEPASKKMKVFIILLSYFLLIYVYAVFYLFAWNSLPGSFDKKDVSFTDSFFLSFTAMTVGPSGLEPNSILTKVILMTEISWGYVYQILVFSLITSLLIKEQRKN